MPKVKLSQDLDVYGTLKKKGDIVNFSDKAYSELKPKGKTVKPVTLEAKVVEEK